MNAYPINTMTKRKLAAIRQIVKTIIKEWNKSKNSEIPVWIEIKQTEENY